MNIAHAFRADLLDLMDRGRQEFWRFFDRAASERHFLVSFAGTGARRRGAAPALARARLEEHARRFFAGASDPQLPTWFAAMPEERRRALEAAEAVCDHSFSLLGHRALFLDEPIDWHRDAISGQRAPFVHWSRIKPLETESVGDSKVTWELNRHQWLVDLGRAYRFSGDERYAECFAARVSEWMHANPPGMGINWASSLEVALRLISWSWALNLFRGAAALTPSLHAEMLAWLRAHATHVEKYQSNYFSPNTHLTGEALGLFYAGVLYPEMPRAKRWRRRGMRVLLDQLARQVLPDGVYFEQSTCYQRYTVEIYLHFLILAEHNDVPVSVECREQICRLLDYLLAVCRPDGSLPQIGDADGGRLLPLSHRAVDDCRGVFATAAALFGRADYAWAARGAAPEVAWLLGSAGCAAFDALQPVPPAHPPSRLFPDGGWAVMQGGWGGGAHQLLFDVGPLGCHVSSGHGHADLLGIQCNPYGRALLVDPGTYCYTSHANWRDYFRGSSAHNTVVVDRQDQAPPAGPFSWRRRARARLLEWRSTPAFDYADARHDAYRRLADPVHHRRRVLFVKPHYWVVVDELTGAEEHQVDLMFQFATNCNVVTEGEWWHAQSGDTGLFIRSFSCAPMEAALHQGEVEPIRGWFSPDYGLRAPAPQICLSAVTQLPVCIVTLLLPTNKDAPSPPEVVMQPTDGGMKLEFDGGRETVRVDARQITVRRQTGPDIAPLTAVREEG